MSICKLLFVCTPGLYHHLEPNSSCVHTYFAIKSDPISGRSQINKQPISKKRSNKDTKTSATTIGTKSLMITGHFLKTGRKLLIYDVTWWFTCETRRWFSLSQVSLMAALRSNRRASCSSFSWRISSVLKANSRSCSAFSRRSQACQTPDHRARVKQCC